MILNTDKHHFMCLERDSVSDLVRFCRVFLKASELETV